MSSETSKSRDSSPNVPDQPGVPASVASDGSAEQVNLDPHQYQDAEGNPINPGEDVIWNAIEADPDKASPKMTGGTVNLPAVYAGRRPDGILLFLRDEAGLFHRTHVPACTGVKLYRPGHEPPPKPRWEKTQAADQ